MNWYEVVALTLMIIQFSLFIFLLGVAVGNRL